MKYYNKRIFVNASSLSEIYDLINKFVNSGDFDCELIKGADYDEVNILLPKKYLEFLITDNGLLDDLDNIEVHYSEK